MNNFNKFCCLLLLTIPIAHSRENIFVDYFTLLRKAIIKNSKYFKRSTVPENIPVMDAVTFWCLRSGSVNDSYSLIDINDPHVTEKIDMSLPIGLVIHGWMDGFNGTWMDAIAQEWNRNAAINVCAVDWSPMATHEYAMAANKDTRSVAQHICKFMKFLHNEHGLDYGRLAIVGHSLGAHIAGFVGAGLNGNVGRIYGLDPAGPLFTIPRDCGTANRLDASDAKFVQVLHTAAGTVGVQLNCGHSDFYPNGGGIPQTGCMNAILTETITCSHNRALDIFRYSLNAENRFVGINCPNWLRYVVGWCSRKTDTFGIHSSRHEGNFYMRTLTSAPYCSKHKLLHPKERKSVFMKNLWSQLNGNFACKTSSNCISFSDVYYNSVYACNF